MSVKNWLKCLLGIVVGTYLFFIVLHYLVNPARLFEHSITGKKFASSEEFTRQLFQHLKQDKYILSFGNSRTARISSEMLGDKVLNFSDLYSEAGDIYNLLVQTDPKQRRNIKFILYLVDIDALKEEKTGHQYLNYKQSKKIQERLRDVFLLNNYKIKLTLRDLFYNYIVHPEYYLVPDGSSVAYKDQTTYQNHAVLDFHKQAYDSSALEKFLKIDRFLKNNYIRVIYYAPTLMDLMFLKVDFVLEEEKFKKILQGGVDEICAPYYIPGISDLKEGNHYLGFSSASHLNGKYLKTVINDYVLQCDSQYLVNQHNVDDYFAHLREFQGGIR